MWLISQATTLTLAVREGGAAVGVPDMYGISGHYAHPNLLANGELSGPVGVGCEPTPSGVARTNCVVGWNTNNAALTIVDMAGRVGVLSVGDQGSFSEINREIPCYSNRQQLLLSPRLRSFMVETRRSSKFRFPLLLRREHTDGDRDAVHIILRRVHRDGPAAQLERLLRECRQQRPADRPGRGHCHQRPS